MSASGAAFDISEHLPPLSARDVFRNSKPVTLDIGCGGGEFLLELSRLLPDFNHIGVEIKAGRFKKAVKAAQKSGAENVRFIHLDGFLAAGLFAPDTFERVYINFPDPWPKDRHRKHRIVSPDFVSVLGSAIRAGGRLEVASDHDEYITSVAEILDRSEEFENCSGPAPLASYPGDRPPTGFEKIFREQGVEIKYLMYRAAGGERRAV